MEFCPKCNGIVFPTKDGILKCNNCGYSNELKEDDISKFEFSKKVESTEETVKMLGEDIDMGPGVNEVCPKCGHDKATYELKQTRSADEAPTRFFTCKKCKHKWREYS